MVADIGRRGILRSTVGAAALALAAVWVVPAVVGAGTAPPELPYEPVPDFLTPPTGVHFVEVAGVAHGPAGQLYVFHRGPQALMEFDPQGRHVRTLGEGLFKTAHGLRVDADGNLWITDVGAHMVLKLSPQGRVLMVLGRKNKPGQWWDLYELPLFDKPTDIAFGPDGEVFVSDGYGNSRVVKFDRDGNFLKAWGAAGSGPSEFNLPHTIAVDGRDRVLVGDRENKRIQIFDLDGERLDEWSHVGSPSGLFVTPDQTVYMADDKADRILELDADGQIRGSLGSSGKGPGQFCLAHFLSVGPEREILVAEVLNWRVQKFIRRR